MKQRTSDAETKSLEFTTIPAAAGAWQAMLSQGRRVQLRKGTELLHGGDMSRMLYYLAEGEIRLTRMALDGRERLLWICGPGSLVGETPLFDEVPGRSALVAGRDSILYGFTREWVLHEVIPHHPDLTLDILTTLALKVRVLCNQTVSLSMDELPARICKFLRLRLEKNAPVNGDPCVIPAMNQHELASLLGVHRVTLNKALRDLEKEGVISPYSRQGIYILDMPRFTELAGAE